MRASNWFAVAVVMVALGGCASDDGGGGRDARADGRSDATSTNDITSVPIDGDTTDAYRGPPPVQRFRGMDTPDTMFPEPGAMPCSPDPASRPTIVYPPEGVLLPPNLNVIEVQFTPGTGNTLWEVDFQNDATDVRLVTRCNPITSVRGRMTGACGATLAQDVWNAVVAPNRGREPVRITVRGTNDMAMCTSTSMATRSIRFAFEDIEGGIFYWQSAVFGGAAGRTGGIYMHDFGDRSITPTPFLESGTTGRCVGCHNLSRDGERITTGIDDPDADDEYFDIATQLMDVRTRNRIAGGASITDRTIVPGFQTFTSDHGYMLTSAFFQPGGTSTFTMTANNFFALYNGMTGAFIRNVMLGSMPGTQPDWSADNRHVVFVSPRAGTISSRGDHHFHGGDLYVLDVDTSYNFSAPRVLLRGMLPGETPSPDAGNYYPAYSPDGNFIAFNHVTAGDIFYNRQAQVWLTTSDGHGTYVLTNLNGGANLTNSWPRWSPFVQRYGNGHILWITFSSNRNYGVRVENDGLPNCYPTASPTEDMPQSTNWATCQQPQIWMAAVGVDTDEFGTGRDTSWPAFWLPFQDVTSHNHSAQWVARVVNRTCVDMGGTCPGPGGTDCCTGLSCDPTTHTCVRACVPEHGACPGPMGETCCPGTDPRNPITCDPVVHRCERPIG